MKTINSKAANPAADTAKKAYNITLYNNNDADIDMYGEVVSTYPVDWCTGEPIPGNFIAVDEFLADLDGIKDKENITIHINSPGGDFYAGLAIYNRLKSLNATITTINDGLAASAASIIFQAGNIRKMNAGSNLMIHGVMGFFFGYYNAAELKAEGKALENHDKAAINAYVEATGRSAEDIKTMMRNETWMAGQEAVDAGFADSVVGEEIELTLSADRKYINSNGRQFPAARFAALAGSLRVSNSAMPTDTPQDANNTKAHDTGGNSMDIKTVEELKSAFPELAAQIENAAVESARNSGAESERQRIRDIESIENTIADKDLVNAAKYGDEPMDARDLTFLAAQKAAKIGAEVLDSMKADAAASGANGVQADPNGGAEEEKTDDAQAINDVVNIFKQINGGVK